MSVARLFVAMWLRSVLLLVGHVGLVGVRGTLFTCCLVPTKEIHVLLFVRRIAGFVFVSVYGCVHHLVSVS